MRAGRRLFNMTERSGGTGDPTDYFTTLKSQNPSIDISKLSKIRQSIDFVAKIAICSVSKEEAASREGIEINKKAKTGRREEKAKKGGNMHFKCI